MPADISPLVEFNLPEPAVRESYSLARAAAELLPTVDDDRAADMIEALAYALVEAEDAATMEREIGRAALALAHQQQVELGRLLARIGDLLNDRRRSPDA